MKKRDQAKRDKVAMIVITLFMWGWAIYLFADLAYDNALAKASVPTECTVVSSKVAFHRNWNDRGRDSESAEVVFTYDADGRRYQRTDNGPRHSDPVEGHTRAAAQARGFQPGQVVPCFRVSGFPSLATVFGRDTGSVDFTARAVIAVGILLIPVVVAVLGRRRRQS